MKKTIMCATCIALSLMLATMTSCTLMNEETVTAQKTVVENANLPGKVLGDYIIELPVITQIDYTAGLAKSKSLFGKFGCSGLAKTLANGNTIVGRSFDLYYSNNPAYVIRTNVDGYYKTVGLAYNIYDGKAFDEVKKNGVTPDELSTLLFFTVDIMNEKGLYIEADMREDQPASTGIDPSTGTNPSAKVSMSFPALVRYLGERCASVNEALELVKKLNVYGMITDEFNWGGGFLMADATGHYGVLELVDNRLIWLDGQNCQTNFYINDEYKNKATIGSGKGRYALLRKKVSTVKSVEDMANLIKQVRYTQIRKPDSCPYDPCTELTGYGKKYESFGGALTIEMCNDSRHRKTVFEFLKELGKVENAKTLKQRRNEGTQWHSVWQTVANCNDKTLKVIFFEDDSLTFEFPLESR